MAKRSKASYRAAAQKAALTRAANRERDARDLAYLLALVERDARIQAKKRSDAARKGAATKARHAAEDRRHREQRTREGQALAAKRSAAAQKGAATKRQRAADRAARAQDAYDRAELDGDGWWEIEVGLDYEG